MTESSTALRKNMGVIAPHGGELVSRIAMGDEAARLESEAEGLPRLRLTEKQTADLDMIASGALSPLTGFMGQADYDRVIDEMHLESGLPWAIPVTLSAPESPTADRLALEGYDGDLLAVIDVAEVYRADREREASKVFRTTEEAHPGVAQIYAEGATLVGGPVTVFRRPRPAFPKLHVDPAETRAEFAERGWSRVVGFQTRNPVHRAHEYIQKCALETVDGLLLHPLVGKTKGDDVPAEVRVRCYEVLLEKYYPSGRTMLSAFPAAMRYAGPREAIWHAIARKNYGCTHFIVGRDHAGVGSYYGTYDAQKIFDEFEPDELGITPLFFEHTFWCHACEGMASYKTCPHGDDQHLILSGTKVREMLSAGEMPPQEFSRPEVAQILIEAYREPAPTS